VKCEGASWEVRGCELGGARVRVGRCEVRAGSCEVRAGSCESQGARCVLVVASRKVHASCESRGREVRCANCGV
jgi:hypothetical protein